MQTKLTRFTKQVVTLAQKAVVGNPRPAVQKGYGGYADWVIVSIHGLKTYLDLPYRRLLDVLYEMPRIARIIGLEVSQLPDFTTVCARMQQLKMPIWRNFLRLSAELHDTGEIQAIDATGMDRVAASQHYAKRTNYTFRAVKTTALIDCSTGVILDIHCSMKQPHDSKVAWQLLTRNLDKLSVLTADKGYDWELLRHKLRSEDVKPVIKYREFGWHGVANNVLLDDTTYHQRSNIESTFFALRRKYGEIVRARTWFGQFRELVLKCAVRNVELALDASNRDFRRLNKAAKQYLEFEEDVQVNVLHQDGNERPDGHVIGDDYVAHLEAERSTLTKPDRVIKNLRRAKKEDRQCVFIVEESQLDRLKFILEDTNPAHYRILVSTDLGVVEP